MAPVLVIYSFLVLELRGAWGDEAPLLQFLFVFYAHPYYFIVHELGGGTVDIFKSIIVFS